MTTTNGTLIFFFYSCGQPAFTFLAFFPLSFRLLSSFLPRLLALLYVCLYFTAELLFLYRL